MVIKQIKQKNMMISQDAKLMTIITKNACYAMIQEDLLLYLNRIPFYDLMFVILILELIHALRDPIFLIGMLHHLQRAVKSVT